MRNGGEYVKECVFSILNQTLQNFNLIVLDNCSNDGTLQWIESLNNNKILIYPSEKSLSIEENWGRIKDVLKNEFITIIGHDDLLHSDYLKTMNELISEHPNASLYQTHFRYIDANGNFVRHCLPMDEKQFGFEFLACHMNRTLDSMGTGYMMRSADYDRVGGMPSHYPNLLFADYELWIKLSNIKYKATAKNECFSYRLAYSTSRITNGMQYQQAFEQYVYFIGELKIKDKAFENVIAQYGKNMLMYYCESLAHRLLKTDYKLRKLSVKKYISKCKEYAAMLIPGENFQPEKNLPIKAALIIDSNLFTRTIFFYFKSVTAKYQ